MLFEPHFISKSKELGLKFLGKKKKRHTNLKTHFCSKPSDITMYNYDLEHVICFSETHVCSSVKWRSHTYSLFQVVERIKSYIPLLPPHPKYESQWRKKWLLLFVYLPVCFFLSLATRRNLLHWGCGFNSFSHWWHNQQERISYKIQKY